MSRPIIKCQLTPSQPEGPFSQHGHYHFIHLLGLLAQGGPAMLGRALAAAGRGQPPQPAAEHPAAPARRVDAGPPMVRCFQLSNLHGVQPAKL